MRKLKFLKVFFPLILALTSSESWALTPFLNLICISKDFQLAISADEMEEQSLVFSRIENSRAVGQAIYNNSKKNEVLAIVADFERKIFTVNLAFAGEGGLFFSSVLQLIAIPGSMATTGSSIINSKFRAIVPESSTYLPIRYSEPKQNSNPRDGNHRVNPNEIELACDLEMAK